MSYDTAYIEEKLRRWENYLQQFSLPDWDELPDTGLRMVEVVPYIRRCLNYLPEGLKDERLLTAAAVNNYVRLRAMPRPKARRYYRVHLAYLLMICTLKQSLSLAMIRRFLPCDLSEAEMRTRYDTYAARYSRLTVAFARTGREVALPVLEGSSGDEAARALVESACVVSAFSRLLAEKLVLLEEENS